MKQSIQQKVRQLANRQRARSSTGITIDEAAMAEEILQEKKLYDNLAVKIVTAIGSVLACIFFLAFLLVAGFWQAAPAVMFVGCVFAILGVIMATKEVPFFLTSLAVTLIIAGQALIGIAYFEHFEHPNGLYLIFLFIATGITIFTNRAILHFLSMGMIITVLFLFFKENTGIWANWSIVLLLPLILLFNVKEALIINTSSWWADRYRPFQMALFAAYLMAHFIPDILFRTHNYSMMLQPGHTLLTKESTWRSIFLKPYSWANSIGILFLTGHILRRAKVARPTAILINAAAVGLLILCWNADLLTGMLLLVLLSVHFGQPVAAWLSLIAFAYSIFVFYYDLNIDLLSKSIIMMASGAILILLWYFFPKEQTFENDKKD